MDFLLYLSMTEQIVTVIVIFSGLSVLGLNIVRMLVPLETLKKNHEVAGFTFGVLGAFYGLLLAFVIVAAWERFDRANANVEQEGVALISLYRLSKGFSAPAASDMQHAIRAYTHRLIEVEWPDMANANFASIDDSVGTLSLWQVVATYNPEDSRRSLLVDKSLDQLANLTGETSLRYLYEGGSAVGGLAGDLRRTADHDRLQLLLRLGSVLFASADVRDLLLPSRTHDTCDPGAGASLPGLGGRLGAAPTVRALAHGRHG